ncbi:hypothetical protein HOA55_01150 [archaeon]|jgi:hypothetical protein|nr:hypothetical protein [archaeon]MBT3577805.1 hypothetical protein [archaeon]MBT6819941.1 hypothetical protein [archaeon]MBT6955851.1 hypothetical protein [archaeon]MBT7025497.1 hypothetical protein [archaeon]
MVALSTLGYFLPIFAFLLVFIVVYALMKKTEVLGENEPVMLFVSLILATFFIVEVSLVELVKMSAAWFAVFFVVIFLILMLLSFTHGPKFISDNKNIAWVLLAALIVFFVISSAYTFSWAVNWDRLSDWVYTDWFGFVLLAIIAAVVSWVLTKKAGN